MRERLPELMPQDLSLAAIGKLLAVGSECFPMRIEAGAPPFEDLSACLVARILTLGESIVHLSELRRLLDVAILIRALYEHVVMLAWISAPRDDSRLNTWRRDGRQKRLKLDADMRAHGHDGVDDDTRAQFEFEVDWIGGPGLPPLVQLAEQADADWQTYLNPSGIPVSSLRGSYAMIYRFGSKAAHPSVEVLGGVVQRSATHSVVVIEPQDYPGWMLPLCVSYLGKALTISSVILGQPARETVKEITDGFGREYMRRQPDDETLPNDQTGRSADCGCRATQRG